MFVRSVPQAVRMKRVPESGRSATLVERRDSGTTRGWTGKVVLFFESGSWSLTYYYFCPIPEERRAGKMRPVLRISPILAFRSRVAAVLNLGHALPLSFDKKTAQSPGKEFLKSLHSRRDKKSWAALPSGQRAFFSGLCTGASLCVVPWRLEVTP